MNQQIQRALWVAGMRLKYYSVLSHRPS